MSGQDPTCRCGHPRTNHEHYRRGTECGACDCHAYRREGGLIGRAADFLGSLGGMRR